MSLPQSKILYHIDENILFKVAGPELACDRGFYREDHVLLNLFLSLLTITSRPPRAEERADLVRTPAQYVAERMLVFGKTSLLNELPPSLVDDETGDPRAQHC